MNNKILDEDNENPTKWHLLMSYSSGPARTAYPLRESYDSEEEARTAFEEYATQAISMGGTVVFAHIEPPKDDEGEIIVLVPATKRGRH